MLAKENPWEKLRRPILKSTIVSLFLSVFILSMFDATASAEGYKSLEGVKSVKAIFDFRDADPGSAMVHLKLIYDTYTDKAIKADKPEFAVIFMGPSVKLLSKNRDGFSAEEKKTLGEFDKVITAMSKDGIRLEVCLFAANLFGLVSDSILPEIHHVENGWISSIGYQKKGYVLIPVF